MKLTLLEMVQAILNNTDGEEVSDINETAESMQIANIIRQSFYNLVSNIDIPRQKNFIQLTASGSAQRPVRMTRPDDVIELEWVKYDKRLDGETEPNWGYVDYLDLESFLRIMPQNIDEGYVDSMNLTINSHVFVFNFYNDRAPSYYTSANDDGLIFDAYDSEIDTTLVAAKTLCYGLVEPTFSMENSFVAPLDHRQFSLLLHEAEAEVWSKLHRVENGRAERRARRNWVNTQHTKYNIDQPKHYPNYPHIKTNYGRC